MHLSTNPIAQLMRRAAICLALLSTAALTGCANFYVSNKLDHVEQQPVAKSAKTQPVQLFFQFETEDDLNLMTTHMVYDKVKEEVTQSGLFSEVRATGNQDTATLQLSINNVPLNNAVGRGFLVGATFGVAGTTVGDGYLCKLQYLPANTTAPITARTEHAIFTSMGLIHGRPVATAVSSADIAIDRVIRQCVKKLLLDLSQTPEFTAAP